MKNKQRRLLGAVLTSIWFVLTVLAAQAGLFGFAGDYWGLTWLAIMTAGVFGIIIAVYYFGQN